MKSFLFDSAKMAALLSESLKKPYDATTLPITTVIFDAKNEDLIRFDVEKIRFEYDLKLETLKQVGPTPPDTTPTPPAGGQGRGGGGFQGRNRTDFHNYSPDKKAFVYAMDHNLYYVEVKDSKDGPPFQLTKDGETD